MPIRRQQTRLQKAQGFANVIGHGNFLLSLKCVAALLELLENLNCAVQSSGKSAASNQ